MLDKLIKFGKKVKQTNSVGLYSISMGATVIKETGNIKVENYYVVSVYPSIKQYKGKTVLYIEDWESNGAVERIDNEMVNIQKLKTHLQSIGLEGLANKLQNTINTLEVVDREDIIKSIEGSDFLKTIFKDFVVYDSLSEEEKKELK